MAAPTTQIAVSCNYKCLIPTFIPSKNSTISFQCIPPWCNHPVITPFSFLLTIKERSSSLSNTHTRSLLDKIDQPLSELYYFLVSCTGVELLDILVLRHSTCTTTNLPDDRHSSHVLDILLSETSNDLSNNS